MVSVGKLKIGFMIKNIVKKLRSSARQRRKKVFHANFSVNKEIKILDLGSEDGTHINELLKGFDFNPENIFIADINLSPLEAGEEKYGFNKVLIPESGRLPFDDSYFDVVFCSSVIEHVTANKKDIMSGITSSEFTNIARKRQDEFASEIKRLGKSYFVQTPNKYFLIESHSWLPFLGHLPRFMQVGILKITNKFWVKKTHPDWLLLTYSDLKKLFPDAKISCEKWFFLNKSFIAIGE